MEITPNSAMTRPLHWNDIITHEHDDDDDDDDDGTGEFETGMSPFEQKDDVRLAQACLL